MLGVAPHRGEGTEAEEGYMLAMGCLSLCGDGTVPFLQEVPCPHLCLSEKQTRMMGGHGTMARGLSVRLSIRRSVCL